MDVGKLGIMSQQLATIDEPHCRHCYAKYDPLHNWQVSPPIGLSIQAVIKACKSVTRPSFKEIFTFCDDGVIFPGRNDACVFSAIGVVTLTKVKHRRELLFAALPTLFAIHQFIQGFVWLGLDGILSQAVAHHMGAAFTLYALTKQDAQPTAFANRNAQRRPNWSSAP
jgi:hypothetical protein